MGKRKKVSFPAFALSQSPRPSPSKTQVGENGNIKKTTGDLTRERSIIFQNQGANRLCSKTLLILISSIFSQNCGASSPLPPPPHPSPLPLPTSPTSLSPFPLTSAMDILIFSKIAITFQLEMPRLAESKVVQHSTQKYVKTVVRQYWMRSSNEFSLAN